MSVVCAVPLQVPVHRMRIRVRCREMGTAVHRAVERLLAHGIEDHALIAAVLGLRLGYVEQVRAELERRLALTEREYLVWVDHARGRCLPYRALADEECAVLSTDSILTLPVNPPTRDGLAAMRLDAMASWDAGVAHGHVEIDEILDVIADRRGSALPGRQSLSHVLQLPDVQLLVCAEEPDLHLRISLAQHAIEDRALTEWALGRFGERLTDEIIDLSAALAPLAPPDWLAADGAAARWSQHEPAPRVLRDLIVEVVDAAEDRIVVRAPDLSWMPAWLSDALERAEEREALVMLCPAVEDALPAGTALSEVVAAAQQTGELIVIADEALAVVHSDATACLNRGGCLRRQYLYSTDSTQAVEQLRERLGLDPTERLSASQKLGTDAIRAMLRDAIAQLSVELPAGVAAHIERDDERFAAETLDRYAHRGDGPTRTMRGVAAGIAWERVLIAYVDSIVRDDDSLELVAVRMAPAHARVDLDVVVRDHRKRVVWVLDAKNAIPNNEQPGGMRRQLDIAAREATLDTEEWSIMGVIVHPDHRLPEGAPRQTEQPRVLRCALLHLASVLQSEQLPDERVGAMPWAIGPQRATEDATPGQVWRQRSSGEQFCVIVEAGGYVYALPGPGLREPVGVDSGSWRREYAATRRHAGDADSGLEPLALAYHWLMARRVLESNVPDEALRDLEARGPLQIRRIAEAAVEYRIDVKAGKVSGASRNHVDMLSAWCDGQSLRDLVVILVVFDEVYLYDFADDSRRLVEPRLDFESRFVHRALTLGTPPLVWTFASVVWDTLRALDDRRLREVRRVALTRGPSEEWLVRLVGLALDGWVDTATTRSKGP